MDVNKIKKNYNIKKRIVILVSICLLLLIGGLSIDLFLQKSYFNNIKYEDVVEKIENNESFIILISQTTCTHCISYKPKLKKVADKNKINIYYIDVDTLNNDQKDDLKSYINFDSTPITVFIKNGTESSAATRINGDASIDKIEKKLKSNGFID